MLQTMTKQVELACKGPHCGAAVLQPATGRPRLYCSDACRQAAYRDRRWRHQAELERLGREEAEAALREVLAELSEQGRLRLHTAVYALGGGYALLCAISSNLGLEADRV